MFSMSRYPGVKFEPEPIFLMLTLDKSLLPPCGHSNVWAFAPLSNPSD